MSALRKSERVFILCGVHMDVYLFMSNEAPILHVAFITDEVISLVLRVDAKMGVRRCEQLVPPFISMRTTWSLKVGKGRSRSR